MRVRIAICVVCTATLFFGAPASAAPPDFDTGVGGPDRIDTWGGQEHTVSGGPVGRPVHFAPNDPRLDPANWVMSITLEFDPASGGTCARVGRRFVLGGDPADVGGAINQIALGLYPLCPGSLPPPQVTAPSAALLLWRDRVKLPPPAPRIAPGWGIVGKEAFLEIGGARDPAPWTFTAFGYTITISAHSRYEVDWGDGTRASGLTSQGGPWPDGRITHPYEVDGTFRVTVRQRWTATWSATDGEQGAIDDGLLTVGALDFPVRELQAVRDR
jgi:hypothetical protein